MVDDYNRTNNRWERVDSNFYNDVDYYHDTGDNNNTTNRNKSSGISNSATASRSRSVRLSLTWSKCRRQMWSKFCSCWNCQLWLSTSGWICPWRCRRMESQLLQRNVPKSYKWRNCYSTQERFYTFLVIPVCWTTGWDLFWIQIKFPLASNSWW